MLLWIFEENTSAIKFYQKCGFILNGASKIYNCDKLVKCVRMTKPLV